MPNFSLKELIMDLQVAAAGFTVVSINLFYADKFPLTRS